MFMHELGLRLFHSFSKFLIVLYCETVYIIQFQNGTRPSIANFTLTLLTQPRMDMATLGTMAGTYGTIACFCMTIYDLLWPPFVRGGSGWLLASKQALATGAGFKAYRDSYDCFAAVSITQSGFAHVTDLEAPKVNIFSSISKLRAWTSHHLAHLNIALQAGYHGSYGDASGSNSGSQSHVQRCRGIKVLSRNGSIGPRVNGGTGWCARSEGGSGPFWDQVARKEARHRTRTQEQRQKRHLSQWQQQWQQQWQRQ